MFTTNNSPDLYVQKNNNLFLARLPGISTIRMRIIDVITSRHLLIFPEISGNFQENLQR